MDANPLRELPSVNQVLESPALRATAHDAPRSELLAAVRQELAATRARLGAGEALDGDADVEGVARRAAERLKERLRPRLRAVINATGIVLHTNLGRAPMATAAAEAAARAAGGYLNLELDLDTGKRSSRQAPVRELVCRVTGAEWAAVVNNNAAATVIALRALCHGREAVISRGQLIEIGGSFRIPEIMAVSGAILREVGTTNITRLADYERALGPTTGAIVQVHTSNYKVSGFTRSVPLPELVRLGRRLGVPVVDDIGSGALVDLRPLGLRGEPVARASVAAGADLVLFSGDKLLGGPQAGLIAGRKDLVHKIERDPLMRAFRPDKMTLAALEATLRLYLDDDSAIRDVPVLRLLSAPVAELRARAEALAAPLRSLPGVRSVSVRPEQTFAGGGSLPGQAIASMALAVEGVSRSAAELARRLRVGEPAVLGRVKRGLLLLDLRTVFAEQEADLVDAVRKAAAPA